MKATQTTFFNVEHSKTNVRIRIRNAPLLPEVSVRLNGNEISIDQCNKIFQDITSNINYGLVWFGGISTIVGYLMLNLVFTYILNI